MRAIVVREFGGPEVMKVEEVADPRPGAGEVLVRVRAVGVNPVETYIRAGNRTPRPELPLTPGADAGRKLVEGLGAEHVLDHKDERHMEKAKELTGGRGVDLIIELLANVNLGKDLPALAIRGRVIVVGSRGNVEITPRDLMSR